jgi:hypothetical protein
MLPCCGAFLFYNYKMADHLLYHLRYDPEESGAIKRVQRGGSCICSDQYCIRYKWGSRGKGEINSASNNLGFRCVKDSVPIIASINQVAKKFATDGKKAMTYNHPSRVSTCCKMPIPYKGIHQTVKGS